MKTINIVPALVFGTFAICLILTCADPTSPPELKSVPLTVHEWGVMCGCTQDSSFRLTALPPDQYQVDLPVLHLHADTTLVCDISVGFNAGRVVLTYPQAETTSVAARWSGVTVYDTPPEMAALAPSPPFELQPYMSVLNQVECSWLRSGSEVARFLFYDGITPFENRVVVEYDGVDDSAIVRNNSDFPIANFYAVFKEPDTTGGIIPPSGTMKYCRIAELDAGGWAILPILSRVPKAMEGDLLALGFTASEAAAVEAIWHQSVFFDFTSRTTILYRVPQSIYDALVPLYISPEPTEIVRALYVLVSVS